MLTWRFPRKWPHCISYIKVSFWPLTRVLILSAILRSIYVCLCVYTHTEIALPIGYIITEFSQPCQRSALSQDDKQVATYSSWAIRIWFPCWDCSMWPVCLHEDFGVIQILCQRKWSSQVVRATLQSAPVPSQTPSPALAHNTVDIRSI